MVKQNALLAVHSRHLGTGQQVGSPPTGWEMRWWGEGFYLNEGLGEITSMLWTNVANATLKFQSRHFYLSYPALAPGNFSVFFF